MPIQSALPALVLPLAIPSCYREPVPAAPTTATVNAGNETIHLSNPGGDLAAAWASNDHRFIGIMGLGLTIPAVPQSRWSEVQEKYGVKTVDGITDVIDAQSAAIRQPALDYATKYNTELLARLAALKEATPPPQ